MREKILVQRRFPEFLLSCGAHLQLREKQILNYTVHNEVIWIFYSFPIYWRGANGLDADEIRHLVLLDGPDR